jgi:hypothetical protein
MKYTFIAFLIPFFIYACSGSDSETDENNVDLSDSAAIYSKELSVYSVPSPAFVTSVLKESGNLYADKLLDDTRNFNGVFGVSSKKFMNLGVYIVDFNYAYMYDQQPTAFIFLDKIDNILKDLQLNNPRITKIMVDFHEYKDSKDSVKTYLNLLQSEINNYLIGNNAEASGLYLLTGMYVEGLYLTLSSFPNIEGTIKKAGKPSSELSQLLLQHQVQLKNLIGLFDNVAENRPDDFLRSLGVLKNEMEKLKLSFHFNKISGRIEKVNFDKSQIKNVFSEVKKFRKEIIKN